MTAQSQQRASLHPLRRDQLGEPLAGPTALGKDPARFWHLSQALAVTDFKLKFFGSVLGYAWQLMKPLLLFGVLYIVFTEVIKLGEGVPFYGVMLLMGIVLFGFFTEATDGAVTCLTDRESLVRRLDFPRLAVPTAVLLTALMNLGLNLVVVVVFLMVSGGQVLWTWVELPLLVIILAVFCFGIGMLLSVAYVRYRDVKPIWQVALQILFYGTPIFYTITLVEAQNPTIARILMCNPLAAVIQQMRHAVIDPSQPSAATAIGGTIYLLIPLTIMVTVVVLGYWTFSKDAPRVAEVL